MSKPFIPSTSIELLVFVILSCVLTNLQCSSTHGFLVQHRCPTNHYDTSYDLMSRRKTPVERFHRYTCVESQRSSIEDEQVNGSNDVITNGAETSTSPSNEKLQSGYDTTDGYESFLYTEKQRKKNKQKDNSLRRKINAIGKLPDYDGGTTASASNEVEGSDEEDEDGYGAMMKKKKQRPFLQKVLMAPFKFGMRVTKTILRDVPEPGTLILVRHGESEWNANKTFTVSFFVFFFAPLFFRSFFNFLFSIISYDINRDGLILVYLNRV